jgi:predicted P-loop ATPase/5S rRNA maturation endonuclease (ribonuclease M5)
MKTKQKNNIDSVRRQCDLKRLVSSYGVELSHIGDRWWGLCPFHEETTPSFTVRQCADGVWRCGCMGCHNPGNGEGDCFDFVMAKESCDLPRATEIIMDVCGITQERKKKLGATLATYDYDGVFQVLRKQMVYEDTGEVIPDKKSFLIRCPDGKGGWVWNERGIPLGGKPLYRQSEFQVEQERRVWVVEGEKDVETLRAAGELATTNAHGARAAWEPQYTEALRGKHVIICGDTDAPGRERDATIAVNLHGVAASVSMVTLPAPHKDITEWIEAGHTVGELKPVAFTLPTAEPGAGASSAGQQHARAAYDDDRARRQHARVEREGGPPDWRSKLICKPGTSTPKALFANAVAALRHAPEFAGKIKFNSFSNRSILRGEVPWGGGQEDKDWDDNCDSHAAEWIQHQGIDVMPAVVSRAVAMVAREAEFHPVRDYLDFLVWDYTARLPSMFEQYFGSVPGTPENKAYLAAAAERWMTCAVARIFEPGCKADYCIVLEGQQGKGKSTSLEALGEPWFTADLSVVGSEQAASQCEGTWIIEIAELASLEKASEASIKKFISQTADCYRRVYQVHKQNIPRQCIFAGTTNKIEYLKSPEGDRRFWPIPTRQVQVNKIKEDRDQLWAEAVWRYRNGAPRFMDSPELEAEAKRMQKNRRISDVWEDRILKYAENPTKEIISYEIESKKNCVTLDDILIHCIGKTPDRWLDGGAGSDKLRIQKCLTANGFVKRRRGSRGGRSNFYILFGSEAEAEAAMDDTDTPVEELL